MLLLVLRYHHHNKLWRCSSEWNLSIIQILIHYLRAQTSSFVMLYTWKFVVFYSYADRLVYRILFGPNICIWTCYLTYLNCYIEVNKLSSTSDLFLSPLSVWFYLFVFDLSVQLHQLFCSLLLLLTGLTQLLQDTNTLISENSSHSSDRGQHVCVFTCSRVCRCFFVSSTRSPSRDSSSEFSETQFAFLLTSFSYFPPWVGQ